MNNNNDDLEQKIDSIIDQEKKLFPPITIKSTPPALSDSDIWRACTSQQDGDAWLFRQIFAGKLVYDHADAKWYEWTDHYWDKDLVDNVIRRLDSVIDLYAKKAAEWAKKKVDSDSVKLAEAMEKEYLKKISHLQKLRWKESVITLSASGTSSLGIAGGEWDKGLWLLGCKNGVIDLRTGMFRSGKQSDFIKTICPISWEGINATSPVWEKTIREIFDGSENISNFLHRLLGYSITGYKSKDHVFPLLWGQGRNGKSTIFEILQHVLGGMAAPIGAETLLDQGTSHSGSSHSADLMDLRGRRITWASETDDGRKINIGKIKWLTGGDTIKARAVYGHAPVSFQSTHTIFLLTNHKPKTDPNDYALWKRICLIPFTLSFVDNPSAENERQRDPDLFEKLQTELPGILAWLVRGCLEWQRQGLNPPKEVLAATEEYKKEDDTMSYFFEDRCVLNESVSCQANDLYREYSEWCSDNGHRHPVTGTRFGKIMKLRFPSERGRKGIIYYGIGLLSRTEDFSTV